MNLLQMRFTRCLTTAPELSVKNVLKIQSAVVSYIFILTQDLNNLIVDVL